MWRSREQLKRAAERYRRSWWLTDAAVSTRAAADAAFAETLAGRPPLDTQQVFCDASGIWSPERRRLHKQLVAAQLGNGPVAEPPVALFTIGGVGAGKTTVLRPLVHAYRRVVHGREPDSLTRIAADEVREGLPEYAAGLGSDVVQREAFAITYGPLYEQARAARLDLVFDTIGRQAPPDGSGFEDSLRELKADGFEVHVLLVETPVPVCAERADCRALTVNGRLVDPQFLHQVAQEPAQALTRLRGDADLLDGWIIVDGSGPPSAPPILDASARWRSRYPDLLDALAADPPS